MEKKKRDRGKQVIKKGPAKGAAQEDLELADEAAQRVKGGGSSSKYPSGDIIQKIEF